MFLVAFVVLATIYRRLPSPSFNLSGRRGNVAALLVVLVLTIGYRTYRTYFSQMKTDARKKAGLRIGIDVDGVLADQIEGILPRIKARLGIFVSSREQVTDWALPLGESDIAREINSAIAGDSEYVRDMQPHSGAQDVIREVYRENIVVIVTARPASVQELTKAWLDDNGLPYDEIISTKEAKKSLHGLDVLVDDYLGNVIEVLSNSDGVGIVMDQPWNREGREVLDQWKDEGRAFIVTDLPQILPIIRVARHEHGTT